MCGGRRSRQVLVMHVCLYRAVGRFKHCMCDNTGQYGGTNPSCVIAQISTEVLTLHV